MNPKCLSLRKFLSASVIAFQLALCTASKSGKQPFRVFINDECLTKKEKAELYAGSSGSYAVSPSLRPSSSRNNNIFSNSLPEDGAYMVYGQSSSGESSTSLSPSSSRNKSGSGQYEFHDGKRILEQYEMYDEYESSTNMLDSWGTDHNIFTPSGKPNLRKTTGTADGGGFHSPKSSVSITSTITNKQSYDTRRIASKASSSKASSSPAGKSSKVICASKSAKASAGDEIENVLGQEQESAGTMEGEEEIQAGSDQAGLGNAVSDQAGLDQAGSGDQNESSISQTDNRLSRMCEALQNNEVFTTDSPMEVEFTYEVAVNQVFNVDEIINRMDSQTAQVVGGEMIDCDNTVQRMRALQQSGEVQGIDSYPPDAVTEESCTYFTAEDGTLPANTDCHVIHGLMTVYLNGTDDGNIAQRIQSVLENLLNREGNQFLDSIQGLEGVHYDYEGAPVTNTEASIDRLVGQTEENQSEQVRSSSWIAGVVLVSLGSIAVLALGFMFLRKKRKERDQESFQKFEDDQSNADTHETLETKDFFVDITVGSDKDEEGSVQRYEAAALHLPRYLTNTEF